GVIVSDKIGSRFGLKGKGTLLGLLLVLEGIGIAFFAASGTLVFAVVSMLIFALFLKMANGCTYGIVPFINNDNMCDVSGGVGAGRNMSAMQVRFLFKSEPLNSADVVHYLGIVVALRGLLVSLTRHQRKPATTKYAATRKIDFQPQKQKIMS